jgi:uncharacterized YigZ family protein
MAADDTYKTIATYSEGSFRDRGSKFIAEAIPVESDTDLKKILNSIKKKHPKANHHCYAMRLTPDKTNFKCNDDGEPAGSAGKPILNALLSNELTDVLIVVSRYFGGTLLGVPGLINAYRSAAQNALDNAIEITKTVNEIFELHFDYSFMNEIMHIIKTERAVLMEQNFNELCKVKFEIRKSKAESIVKRFDEQKHRIINYKLIRIK